jgi:hypothetical protein
MTCTESTRSPRRHAARLIAGVAVAAVLALGVSAGTANARWDHRDDHRDDHRGWTGGYYNAPPVVYGSPYAYGYYPPPVAYGPGIGINLPGVNIGIR